MLAVAWNAVAAAVAAVAVSQATESTDPVGLTEAGDEAEEEESDAEVAADAERRVESGALAKAGESADTSHVADVPDASESSVTRAWPWSFACARSEVAAPAVATAAVSRPLPLPEALTSAAAADIGGWSVASVDALATSSVVSDALLSAVATVLASAPKSEPAGKALMDVSAGMDVAIWLVPTVGMPRSVAAIA
ncbi:hypothetical protein D3C85_1237680 [compost metagenome]